MLLRRGKGDRFVKRCDRCEQEKDYTAFRVSRTSSDGLEAMCRECQERVGEQPGSALRE